MQLMKQENYLNLVQRLINGFDETGAIIVTSLFTTVPLGNYRVYVKPNNGFVSEIIGAGECYNCRSELFSGKGQEISIDATNRLVVVDLEPLVGAQINGKLKIENNADDSSFYSVVSLWTNNNSYINTYFLIDESLDPTISEFRFSGLAAGDYFLRYERDGFIRELYGDVSCPFFACIDYRSKPIRIGEGETKVAIDTTLQKGALFKGNILDAETNDVLVHDDDFFR